VKLLLENWREYLSKEEKLYHGTSDLYYQDILDNGIKAPSYWGTPEVAEYYSEVVTEEVGGNPVIIEVSLSRFNQDLLEPDYNSIDEPLTYTLGKTEEEVWEEWEQTGETWQDSLEIVASVLYKGVIVPQRGEVE